MDELIEDTVESFRHLVAHSAVAVAAVLVATGGFAASAAAQTGGDRGDSELPSTGPDQEPSEEAGEQGPSLRERILYLMSGYHFTPSREDLDELAEPSEITDHLRAIATDGSMRPSLRGRAVDLLALYDTDRVGSFLEGLIEPIEEGDDAQVASMLRHRAIMSLAELYGDQKAVQQLEHLLDSEDRQIRLTTIAALGQHAGEPGKKRLEAYASQVDDEIVRRELGEFVDAKRLTETED